MKCQPNTEDSTVTTEVRKLDRLRAMVDRRWDMADLKALAATDEVSSQTPSGRNPPLDRTSTTDLAVISPRKRTPTSKQKRCKGRIEIMLEMRKECLSFEISISFPYPFLHFSSLFSHLSMFLLLLLGLSRLPSYFCSLLVVDYPDWVFSS